MRTNPAFILRNIYDQYILMPICTNNASNDPILLNEVAASIWKAASDGLESKIILENLSKSYGLEPLSPEAIAIEQFMIQMINMGLLFKSCEEA